MLVSKQHALECIHLDPSSSHKGLGLGPRRGGCLYNIYNSKKICLDVFERLQYTLEMMLLQQNEN